MIRAEGFETLTTHVYERGDPDLHRDALFGVKPELIASTIELNTDVCANIEMVRCELSDRLRSWRCVTSWATSWPVSVRIRSRDGPNRTSPRRSGITCWSTAASGPPDA